MSHLPRAMSEKKAPNQSVARKIYARLSSVTARTTQNTKFGTYPVDANHSASAFPYLAVGWEQSCRQQNRCNDANGKDGTFVTAVVDGLLNH